MSFRMSSTVHPWMNGDLKVSKGGCFTLSSFLLYKYKSRVNVATFSFAINVVELIKCCLSPFELPFFSHFHLKRYFQTLLHLYDHLLVYIVQSS